MKKVGILTFHWANHYGAVLQAYALLRTLRELGYEAIIINYEPILSLVVRPVIKPKFLIFKYKSLSLPTGKTIRSMVGEVLYYLPYVVDERRKEKEFNNFRRMMLNILDNEIVELEELKNECLKYYAVIVGSDQVWNPEFLKYSSHAYLLPFRLKDTRKIGFSASIGINISDIPSKFINLYKKYLKDFSFISVREKTHAEWLTRILGCEVHHTLDPTLVVSKDDFNKIYRKYESTPENYLLFYNLDPNILPFVKELERYMKLPILIYKKPEVREWRLYGKYVRGRESFYHVGPREFIGLLKGADLVFTDSYHGLTLSLVFEKPVVVVINNSSHKAKVKTRIEDLVQLLELNEIVVRDREDLKRALRTEIDYSDVRSRLSELRRRSLDLLKEALMEINS